MKKKAIAAALLAMAAGAAHAQSAKPGWYAGVDLGRSRNGASNVEINAALADQGVAGTSMIDQTATTFGVNTGYRFSRRLAVEAALERLGRFDFASVTATDRITGRFEATALSLAGVASYPYSDSAALYAKVGVSAVESKLEPSSSTGATAVRQKTNTVNGLLLGVGVTFDLNATQFVKAGWDRYARVAIGSTGKNDLNAYLIGVGMRF